MKPELVTQPTVAPTRKLTASLVGFVAGALLFEGAAHYMPALRDVQVLEVGNLSLATQLIVGGLAGYFVRDRAN